MTVARHDNIARATTEARKVLLQTKSWNRTKEHLDQWIMMQYAVSYHTKRDYINNVYSRLLRDKELEGYLDK